MRTDRLRGLREQRGLSQGEAAKRIGIARTTYSNYEAGNREPDIDTLIRMADFYDVSIDYLVGRANDPKMTFSEAERFIYDKLELSDEEIMSQVDMYYDGMKLTDEEKKEFLAIVRGIFSVRRASK